MSKIAQCAKCAKPASEDVKLKVCGGCGEVGYCSKECQTSDWKTHKKFCKKKHKAGETAGETSHLRSQNAADIPVLWEDQKNINSFGRLNHRMNELHDEAEAQKTKIAGLKDANDEIECLLDDDACRIKVGEMYVDVTNDEATEFAEARMEREKGDLKAIQAEQATLNVEMDKLKAVLYAKFGQTINLETSARS